MPTRGFRSSVLIDRPVDEVWSFLTNWEEMPRWMNGVDSMRALSDGPVGTGTELRFVARGAERPSTITAWASPKQLTLSSIQGGITATYHYRCEKEKDGTRLTLNAQCTANGGLWRLAHPLIGYLMKRSDSDQPSRFKKALLS
ncbi:MAG: SRPBCC family protein [Acidiferrobacterales bacterium]